MTDAPDLVTLLYRADWTRLSLAAEVSKMTDHDLSALRSETGLPEADVPPGFVPRGPRPGSSGRSQPTGNEWEVATDLQGVESSLSSLLIAPGGRYRHQGDGFIYGCDGDRSWHVFDDDVPVAEWAGAGRLPALSTLLQPSWLLTGFTLETGEPVTACGRAALRAAATPRPSIRATAGHRPVERIEVIVDAELGILLRQEEIFDGKPLSVTELVSISLDPAGAGDVAPFQPPSGWDAAKEEAEPPSPGPGWGPARVVANLASSGIGTLVRSSSPDPFGQATREEPEAAMPEYEPLEPDGSPVSDEVLHLLYASESRWSPEIAATLHQWRDLTAMLAGFPEQVRRVGFGGFGTLFEAVGQRIPTVQIHTVSSLRIGEPDRYQIDVIGRPGKGDPKTTVCDGQQRWRVFDDEVTVGPAAPPPVEIADLFDASWLLTARLTGGSETTVGGRRGYRLAVTADGPGWRRAFGPDEVVVDAELGFLLRWITRPGSQVTAWYELRDVAASAGELADFQPDIPAGARVVEETPADDAPPGPVNIGASAGIFARQAAKEARSAVEELLGFFRGSGG